MKQSYHLLNCHRSQALNLMHLNWLASMFRSHHDGRVINFGWICKRKRSNKRTMNWIELLRYTIRKKESKINEIIHTYHGFSSINYVQRFPSDYQTNVLSFVVCQAVVTVLCSLSSIYFFKKNTKKGWSSEAVQKMYEED